MAPSFRAQARLFLPAFAVDVAEEAPGVHGVGQAERLCALLAARLRAQQRARIRGSGYGGCDSQRQPCPQLAYYTLVVTQQAVFDAVSTIAFREYSPGLITSLLNAGLWRRLTRAALAERRVANRDLPASIHAAGALHAAVVARQVFFLGVPEA